MIPIQTLCVLYMTIYRLFIHGHPWISMNVWPSPPPILRLPRPITYQWFLIGALADLDNIRFRSSPSVLPKTIVYAVTCIFRICPQSGAKKGGHHHLQRILVYARRVYDVISICADLLKARRGSAETTYQLGSASGA